MAGDSPTVTITVALIGLAGIIVGALLNMFADEIRGLVAGKKKKSGEFIGKWRCTWLCDYGARMNQTLEDTVEVTKVMGDKFLATGTNNNGTYEMTGTIKNNDIILLYYTGDELRDALGGVIILASDKRRKNMTGRWDEYSEKEEFRGGTTTWQKER